MRPTRVALSIVVAALALVLAGGAPSRPTGRVVDVGFRSVAIGGKLRLAVYLPPGYDRSGLRYPVVYFLHGLPAPATAYRGIDFLRRALERTGRAALIVAPQGARAGDTDAEYLDWGPGRRWESAIAGEVPAFVDAHFRTIPNRRARAIVGLSAGGYGAVLVALHHLGRFSVVESWSGYFHPTTPDGREALDLGSAARNAHASAHAFVSSLRTAFAKRPTFFAFYVGRGDDRFRDENEQLNRELVAARVPHVFHVYPGGHEETVWSGHARAWLGLALDHLDQPAH
jgi:S-formylglutathione hydrolase FrmB